MAPSTLFAHGVSCGVQCHAGFVAHFEFVCNKMVCSDAPEILKQICTDFEPVLFDTHTHI